MVTRENQKPLTAENVEKVFRERGDVKSFTTESTEEHRGKTERKNIELSVSFICFAASFCEFCRSKKIVVAGWIHLQAVHPLGINHHVIEVPQVDVRQIFGENLLDLRVVLLARILVRPRAGFRNYRLDPGL